VTGLDALGKIGRTCTIFTEAIYPKINILKSLKRTLSGLYTMENTAPLPILPDVVWGKILKYGREKE
jgi:hypothetical protein